MDSQIIELAVGLVAVALVAFGARSIMGAGSVPSTTINKPTQPTGADIDAMGLEELTNYRAWYREQMREASNIIDATNSVYTQKVAELHLNEARAQVNKAAADDGITGDEMARRWLESDQPGRRIQARLYLGLQRVREG